MAYGHLAASRSQRARFQWYSTKGPPPPSVVGPRRAVRFNQTVVDSHAHQCKHTFYRTDPGIVSFPAWCHGKFRNEVAIGFTVETRKINYAPDEQWPNPGLAGFVPALHLIDCVQTGTGDTDLEATKVCCLSVDWKFGIHAAAVQNSGKEEFIFCEPMC